jgi:hypothetical protein
MGIPIFAQGSTPFDYILAADSIYQFFSHLSNPVGQCTCPRVKVLSRLEMAMKLTDKEFLEEVDILREEGIDIRVVIC